MRLRAAVEVMPVHARRAMLRGIADSTIIVGAYADPRIGGICPMLAAHRNGGRIDLASFARSWDRYTDAEKPRRATPREIRTLVALLESSLADELILADDAPLASERPRQASPPLAPPERPGLAYRIRRLPRRHLSRVAARTR